MSKKNHIDIRRNTAESVGALAQELLHQLRHRGASEDQFIPKADVWESETGYHISVYLPGIKQKAFGVELNDDFLVVRGRREMREDLSEQKVKLLESNYGSFQRRIKLNAKANIEDVQANFEDGVLYILIPKKQAEEYVHSAKVA